MPEIRFLNRLAKTPVGRTRIFSLKRPRVNERTLLDLADRFELSANLKRGRLQLDDARIRYSEGPVEITLFRASGGLHYHDRLRWQMDDGQSRVEFTDETAIEIARGFIKKTKLAPLRECELLKVTHLHAGTVERETRRSEERIIDVGVAFRRVINGVPVDGPGGKVIIYIDHRGEVTGADRLWRETEKVYRPVKELRPFEYVEEQLERYWRQDESGHIEVHEVRFGYFEQGWRDPQRYLQPAYILMLRLVSPDERFHRKAIFVAPAAENSVGRLMPLLKPVHVQGPREGREHPIT